MKIILKTAIVIFALLQIIFSQEPKSIHQIEWERYPDDAKVQSKPVLAQDIVALDQTAYNQKALSSTVFGYLPYWVYNHPPHYFQFDLLTHIAIFDFSVNITTGTIGNPPNWPWTDAINDAHRDGVKVIMCVVEFDDDKIHTLITDQTLKNNFFSSVKEIIDTYKLDGINIDFEGLHLFDRTDNINPFMAELTEFVHSNIGEDKEVSFAAPPVNWAGWNFMGLAAACDYLFVMGYDFWGGWSSTAGPSSPLEGANYSVTQTLTENVKGYGPVVFSNPEKLILGVPYYGNKWRTASQSQGSSALSHIGSMTYSEAKQELGSHDLLWSSTYQTPWYTYENNGNYYQTWYDNNVSLELKYDLAHSKNLKGVGMWALGYDKHHTELWDLLRDKFFLNVANVNDIPDIFELHQNYPNPFNPVTTIDYELRVADNIELSVYNLLGKKIKTLVNQHQNEGRHSIIFNADGLASGTYFYQIKTDSYLKVKKMILLK